MGTWLSSELGRGVASHLILHRCRYKLALTATSQAVVNGYGRPFTSFDRTNQEVHLLARCAEPKSIVLLEREEKFTLKTFTS